MQARAAILKVSPGSWEVSEVNVDGPKAGEILVRITAAGLCHSDYHFVRGDMTPARLPLCGGHEGAGVVEAIGEGVRSVGVGDHVVASFIPSCGRCRWCASGMQNLCDNGALMLMGTQLDGTFRMHHEGHDVAQMSGVGTFSELCVMSEYSCVPIDKSIPLEIAALLSCGVPTGWGSAVNAAAVEPGDVVIVIGIGGVGIHAVQGARHAGASRIVGVDPVEMKRKAALTVGATDVCDSMADATDLVRSLTNGQGADAAIVTMGLMSGQDVGAAISAVRKAGTVVLTSGAAEATTEISASLIEVVMYQKRVQGALYGMMSPNKDVPRLLRLWQDGQLQLGGDFVSSYPLADINQGYADLLDGQILRGVITF